MSALYLIRHAQAGPRHKYDRLSDLGYIQAQRLGEYFAAQEIHFTAVYSGALQRQQATAQAVEQIYRARGLPFPTITQDPHWDEFDLTEVYRHLAEPLSRDDDEFSREYAEMMALLEDENHQMHRNHNYCDIAIIRAWVRKRYEYEGESWDAFRARVAGPLETLAGYNSGEHVAVFTSATPISLWVGRALGLNDDNIWRIAGVAYNTSITTFRLHGDDFRLFTFNGVPHLNEPNLRTFR